jgi:hypothetical protein
VSGRIQLLATLFGLQLLLVGGFLYSDFSDSSSEAPGLLEFVAEDVDRLVIRGDGEEVELAKGENGWDLSAGIPADADKIAEVLDKLIALHAPWPVATSEGSRERFEVTAQSHQRHVQMFSGTEPVADLYLGTSPGYRRVHARAADADEVYSIDFSNFEVPVAQDEWLDKDLLQAVGAVTEVARVGLWTVSKGEEGWLLGAIAPARNAAEQSAADPEAAKKLIDRIGELRVTGFAPVDASLTEKGAFSITDEAGSHQLRFYHDEEEDTYVVESDRVPGRFSVAAYIAEQVIVTEEALRVRDQPAEEPTQDDPLEAAG